LTENEEKESANVQETVPEWMHKYVNLQMDDFTDVNDGEKQIMKLWNHHMLEHSYVAEIQMKEACISFVHSKGREIISKNLYRCFILHLNCLFDFDVLCAVDFHTVVLAFHQFAAKMYQDLQTTTPSVL
jgi:polycomb protein SUZ12